MCYTDIANQINEKLYNQPDFVSQHDPGCDEEDDCCDMDDDEIISTMLPNEEKFYPGALEKMIGCVALLLEEARDGP